MEHTGFSRWALAGALASALLLAPGCNDRAQEGTRGGGDTSGATGGSGTGGSGMGGSEMMDAGTGGSGTGGAEGDTER